MPFCTACGKQNPDDARFCAQCGTKLLAGEDTGSTPVGASPVETLQTDDGATVEIEDIESVEITSVREPSRPEYAELVEGQ